MLWQHAVLCESCGAENVHGFGCVSCVVLRETVTLARYSVCVCVCVVLCETVTLARYSVCVSCVVLRETVTLARYSVCVCRVLCCVRL